MTGAVTGAVTGAGGGGFSNAVTELFKAGGAGGGAVDDAIKAGMNQGAADVGVGQPNDNGAPAGNGEPNGDDDPSWVSQNWPWLLVGGIGVVTVAIVAGTVLTSGDKTMPLPPSASVV